MKLIVGLGNPGEKYKQTRHNAGFLAIDYFLKDIGSINCQSKFHATVCEAHFGPIKTFFVKPQTFMNESGQAVKEILNFYKARPQTDLLVIHDDSDLPLGTIRMAADSSSAGHNGVQSIIDELGSQEFQRIRIGIDTRKTRDELPTENFVLLPFTVDKLNLLNKEVFPKVSKKIQDFINS